MSCAHQMGAYLRKLLGCVLVLLFCIPPYTLVGLDLYVSLDGSHQSPFTNWYDAATDIQSAVDEAAAGDYIWVAPGIYSEGATTNLYGRNRVTVDEAITITAVSNREATVILGEKDDITNQVRCVFLGTNAVLSGFTLREGGAGVFPAFEPWGGGIILSASARVENCIIEDCTAEVGGGIYMLDSGLASDCLVQHCTATDGSGIAGRAGYCLTTNSMFKHNSASRYGTLFKVHATHSIMQSNSGNVAVMAGGIADYCFISDNGGNSIIEGGDELGGAGANYSVLARNGVPGGKAYAILWEAGAGFSTIVYGSGNSSSLLCYDSGISHTIVQGYGGYQCDMAGTVGMYPEEFMDAANSDFRLRPTATARDLVGVDESTNYLAGVDIRGLPRVYGGRADFGAYEFQGEPDGDISAEWLASYGIPTNQVDNFLDPDADGFSTWQEYVAYTDPTNSGSQFQISLAEGTGVVYQVPSWSAYTNRLYTLSRASLSSGNWTTKAVVTVNSNQLYTYQEQNGEGHSLYRVEVTIPYSTNVLVP